jgi:hypothetical protein
MVMVSPIHRNIVSFYGKNTIPNQIRFYKVSPIVAEKSSSSFSAFRTDIRLDVAGYQFIPDFVRLFLIRFAASCIYHS